MTPLSPVSEECDDVAIVQQSIVRLINAMASIKTGRDYLGKKCYKILIFTKLTPYSDKPLI